MVVVGGLDRSEGRPELGEIVICVALGDLADTGRLDESPGLMDVSEGRAAVFQDQRRVAGGHVTVGCMDAGPAMGAPAHADQRFGLQDPERLAQRRARDTELLHQHGFRGKSIAFDQFTPHYLAPQVRRDQLGGLGDAYLPADAALADHRSARAGGLCRLCRRGDADRSGRRDLGCVQ